MLEFVLYCYKITIESGNLGNIYPWSDAVFNYEDYFASSKHQKNTELAVDRKKIVGKIKKVDIRKKVRIIKRNWFIINVLKLNRNFDGS